MLFIDYAFDLLPGGSIRFDKELKLTDIKASEGDEFVVKIIDGGIVFAKKGE
ncbi:hypothetical protein UFOVP447_254 [uncultured Caudovirales phage]|uniref:Uncharacterized protein n=1 Tax=uncultured Caudovirales phage TaxID=2100421 RepID=A0A6J5MEM8_9CAUD|nr:hypothetical protein UFOVP447_254 [uncultured Caudovirales phage]